jgi:hypothetical protein
MENSLESIACPLCGNPQVEVTPYADAKGFRLIFKCEKHRTRIYFDNFGKGFSIPPAKPAAIDSPRTSRAKELLARAAALAGEEKQAA